MIIDDPNTPCDPEAPGADIDAIELYRGEALIGWAESVESVEAVFDTGCVEAGAAGGVPEETLGESDGVFEDGYHEGTWSLNGNTIYLRLSEPMQNGDTLVVYELDPEDEEVEDCFQIYLGYDTEDGDMAFTDESVDGWGPRRNPSQGCETLTKVIDGLW